MFSSRVNQTVFIPYQSHFFERRYPEERKAWPAKLLQHAFGSGKAESALKKRMRYIRFDGEVISDQDQLFATRREVLRLSDAWDAIEWPLKGCVTKARL